VLGFCTACAAAGESWQKSSLLLLLLLQGAQLDCSTGFFSNGGMALLLLLLPAATLLLAAAAAPCMLLLRTFKLRIIQSLGGLCCKSAMDQMTVTNMLLGKLGRSFCDSATNRSNHGRAGFSSSMAHAHNVSDKLQEPRSNSNRKSVMFYQCDISAHWGGINIARCVSEPVKAASSKLKAAQLYTEHVTSGSRKKE
jgi:hypothetical protein